MREKGKGKKKRKKEMVIQRDGEQKEKLLAIR